MEEKVTKSNSNLIAVILKYIVKVASKRYTFASPIGRRYTNSKFSKSSRSFKSAKGVQQTLAFCAHSTCWNLNE